jgi:hypothetical protein
MKLNKADHIFAVFATAALIVVALHFLFHPVRVLGMNTSIFYMDERLTLAAFYTTVVAFMVGFLTLININRLKGMKERLLYSAYGMFFIYLAFDEYFEIHE